MLSVRKGVPKIVVRDGLGLRSGAGLQFDSVKKDMKSALLTSALCVEDRASH
jgi:hypothetical protein